MRPASIHHRVLAFCAAASRVVIAGTRWVEEEGEPDALEVSLSTGLRFLVRWKPSFALHFLYLDSTVSIPSDCEPAVTGLTRGELNLLGSFVCHRYAEQQDEVEP